MDRAAFPGFVPIGSENPLRGRARALGEAIKDLARKGDLSTLDPGGPWREPARFRAFLAHDYDDQVIPALLWNTITSDLQGLDDALMRIDKLVGGPCDPEA